MAHLVAMGSHPAARVDVLRLHQALCRIRTSGTGIAVLLAASTRHHCFSRWFPRYRFRYWFCLAPAASFSAKGLRAWFLWFGCKAIAVIEEARSAGVPRRGGYPTNVVYGHLV